MFGGQGFAVDFVAEQCLRMQRAFDVEPDIVLRVGRLERRVSEEAENALLVVEMRGGSYSTFSRLLVPVSSPSLRIYGHGEFGVMRSPDTGGFGIGVGHVIRRRRTRPRSAAGLASQ